MDQMRAGADPRLRTDLGPGIGDARDGYESAAGDAPGEGRGLPPEKRGSHRRTNAVRSDENVGGDALAVVEPGFDAFAAVGKSSDAMTVKEGFSKNCPC